MAYHEVDNARYDLGAKALAVEDIIVPYYRLHVVRLYLLVEVDKEVIHGLPLSKASSVIVLALDSEQ